MASPTKIQRLYVSMNGEHVGYWDSVPNRPQEFTYAASWTTSEAARPISLSLPISAPDARYSGPVVGRFFENLLPDSREIRLRIGRHVGAASDRAFDLLAKIGRDCAGALNEIHRRHFLGTAKRCGVAAQVDALLEALIDKTPTVIATVNTRLPKGFLSSVSEPILKGLEASARALAS